MATIIFDFDHTLLQTSEITLQIRNIFLKNEVPEKTIDSIQKSQRQRDNDNVDLLVQIRDVEKLGYKINKNDIDDFFSQEFKQLLNGPVIEVLEKLLEKKHKLFLFTKGVEYFQRFKIRQAGLEKYFKENIFVFDNDKTESQVNIFNNGKVYFVNDHADEIETFIKVHPTVKAIYIKGPKTSHDRFIKRKHIPTLDDISLLPKYIK